MVQLRITVLNVGARTEAREPILPWFGRKYVALLDLFAFNIPMLSWKYCVSLLIPVLVVSLSVCARAEPQIKKEQVDKAVKELKTRTTSNSRQRGAGSCDCGGAS